MSDRLRTADSAYHIALLAYQSALEAFLNAKDAAREASQAIMLPALRAHNVAESAYAAARDAYMHVILEASQ